MTLPLPHQRVWLDPVPELDELRKDGPLHEYDSEPGMDGRKQWLVTGYDEVRQILADHHRFSSARPVDDEADRARLPGILQAYDPPEHTRLRRTVSPAYSARRMERLRPRIEEIVEDGLDDFESVGSPADFVRHAAWPIPAFIACEFLGVPRDDQAELSRMIRETRESKIPRQRVASGLGVVNYTERLAASKRRDPDEGMIGALVREHGDQVTDEELAGLAEASLTMATEQVAAQLAVAVLLLVSHPAQLALLRERPELVDGAIEEVLRYGSVVEAPSPRVALADVRVAGRDIRAGEVLTCSMLAINRAPGDRFDITRRDRTHLSFGHGIHHCIGAPLVRLELRVMLPAVVRRFPSLRLAVPEEELRFKPGRPAPFAVEELPLEW
ncbi:cytochrome P450 [Actinoplanes sp. ATCC 53533]|uniref:cytochrome P450 n=1 Tax=Actinoplanes sp. ATCC 53533 TaxID=1288362 RepID=UPI0003846F48|nr:cytochrome P450 [Actinoplanes sp. ATCC 53533]AGE10747.1 P450 monooxygenase OxyE [Actinoplanes sp. ATCC 53533]AGS77322.1 OxyE monooxygenase [Actinoplanes sp. ATCC 53533]RSM44301.1 cytochrome P450 [Actinoplanes sp. ATCC 53533]